uniref:Uncharacterized protein n=1 Tax=Mus musculus TaxID=10090 RepID=Q8BV32_MOUSE|nr:unnamed protein product [Mus musculus]
MSLCRKALLTPRMTTQNLRQPTPLSPLSALTGGLPPSRKQVSRIDSLVQRGHERCLCPARKQLDHSAPKERTPQHQCGATREHDHLAVIACRGLSQVMVVVPRKSKVAGTQHACSP